MKYNARLLASFALVAATLTPAAFAPMEEAHAGGGASAVAALANVKAQKKLSGTFACTVEEPQATASENTGCADDKKTIPDGYKVALMAAGLAGMGLLGYALNRNA